MSSKNEGERTSSAEVGAGRWVDVFASADFVGERRRFFAPARIDGAMLGEAVVSLRSAVDTNVCLIRRDGTRVMLNYESPALDLADVVTLELSAVGGLSSRRVAA